MQHEKIDSTVPYGACLISLVGCAGDTNMDEKKPNNTASAYALALASYPEMAP